VVIDSFVVRAREFLAEQFLASVCIGCSAARGPVCVRCVAHIEPHVTIGAYHGIPVSRAVTYEPPISQLVIAFKDRGEWSLRPLLGHLLARSIAHLLVTIEEASPVLLHSPILLAPIAATVDSIRLRDADPVADLADTAAALLRRSGMKIRSQRLLSMRQGHRDHVGLSRGERIANMHDAFTLRGRAPCGAPVVLVDDVVTTGATLASAQRVLVGAGFDVLGAGVIAAAKGGLT